MSASGASPDWRMAFEPTSPEPVPHAPGPTGAFARTLVDQIAAAIFRMAVEGRFAPGERMREAEIARQLNVSRIPLREALRLLEADGLVRSEPYKGMRFMSLGEKQIRDIRQVRLQLEIMAARLCLEDGTQLDRLEAELGFHLQEMLDGQQRHAIGRIVQHDIAFHRAICRLSSNETLLRFYDSASSQLHVIFTKILRETPYSSLRDDHQSIVDAFATRRLGLVEQALSEHVLAAADLLFRAGDGGSGSARRDAGPGRRAR